MQQWAIAHDMGASDRLVDSAGAPTPVQGKSARQTRRRPALALALLGLVGAAIWLEEFAPKNKLTDIIEVNINNLAAVPSIVYGAFGLEFSPIHRTIFLFYLILALALVTNFATLRLRRLPIGRAWEALREGRADVAFVRGGSDDTPEDEREDANDGILSLGALFYEPLWLFYRPEALQPKAPTRNTADAAPPALQQLRQLRGLRVNLDQTGSGVPDLMRRLLQANGLGTDAITGSTLPPEAAAQALLSGEIDAMVLVTAPESPVVQRLLQAKGIALADLPQADALARRFPFLQTVTLPRGMVDLARDQPPGNVGLLAATTALLTHEDTHPALRQLFAEAAQQIHGGAGWFNGVRDFPNTRTSELPVSPEGDRAINGTPPFWQRYLPFWASNLLERMWLVIGGLIVLLLPLSRVVPPLYTYRVRQRIFRWYARLRQVEARMDEGTGPGDVTELLDELDELDRVASQIAVPLAHAEELYALKNNIDSTRRRLLARKDLSGA